MTLRVPLEIILSLIPSGFFRNFFLPRCTAPTSISVPFVKSKTLKNVQHLTNILLQNGSVLCFRVQKSLRVISLCYAYDLVYFDTLTSKSVIFFLGISKDILSKISLEIPSVFQGLL